MTDTATVTIIVGPTLIWFIDNTATAGGDGRITSPFNSIAAFNSTASDDPGDIIFLYTGTGTYEDCLVLLDNQKLIGQGVALQSETGAPPTGSAPLPGAGMAPFLQSVILAQNNTVRGVNTSPTTGDCGEIVKGDSDNIGDPFAGLGDDIRPAPSDFTCRDAGVYIGALGASPTRRVRAVGVVHREPRDDAASDFISRVSLNERAGSRRVMRAPDVQPWAALTAAAAQGGNVSVNIGTLPAGDSVTITF